MPYGMRQLLLLSQSGFKQLLAANLLLINTISAYANLLQYFIFAHFLLIERRLWKVCTTKGDGYCSFKHTFFESLTDKFQ